MTKVLTHEDYKRAEQLLGKNSGKFVFNSFVEANWFGEKNQFWYRRDLRIGNERGKRFFLVSPLTNTCVPAFNHERLAQALEVALGQPCDPDNLPFDQFEYVNDDQAIQFLVAGDRWICDLAEYSCVNAGKVDEKLTHFLLGIMGELPSPDGRWTAYTEDYNLYVRSNETDEVIQLTFDGEPFYDYASQPESRTSTISERLRGIKLPPTAIWSPDSTKLLTHRLDQRQVPELYLLQSVPAGEDVRPVLHTYRYSMPGDEQISQAELVICDIEQKTVTKLDTEPVPVHYISFLTNGLKLADWSRDGDKVYFVRISRDYKLAQFVIADPITGTTKRLLEEKSETFFNIDGHNIGDIGPGVGMCNPNIRLLDDGASFIWHSERDNWSHLYLYDAHTGELKNRITSGSWVVRRLLGVDEERGWVYFTAGGREAGRDPYYQHLYRVRLDGNDLTLLTPEDAEHAVTLSPSLEYFVDTFSRVDMPPVSVLRSVDGSLLRELEQADIELLLAAGYQMPERVTFKSSDGVTDLYGILVRPANLDPNRKYPIIDFVYGGPQRVTAPRGFCGEALLGMLDLLGGAQSFAQLGFATVILDGKGTPYRGKAFHDATYGNLQSSAGLADHIPGIKQLAERYPYLDIERVGTWGMSGGGYGSTRAILQFPDFYKVAVSGCGNHDQRLYISDWGERFQGALDAELYREQDNASLAANLRGKLLLVHGELDDNVHPAHTIRMVDALIKANKDFDLLILPNTHHDVETDYFTRRNWDYFVEHLLGAEPPKGYVIGEM